MGEHKGKNIFDIMIKVTPRLVDKDDNQSIISLTSRTMDSLNIRHVINRPFDCDPLDEQSSPPQGNHEQSMLCGTTAGGGARVREDEVGLTEQVMVKVTIEDS